MSNPNAAADPAPATPAEPATPVAEGTSAPAPTPAPAASLVAAEPTTPVSEGGDPAPTEGEGEGTPAPAAPEVTPLTIEAFTLPEGMEVNDEQFSSALAVVNDPELSPQQVGEKLINMQITAMHEAGTAAETASNAAWDEMQTTWQTESKALPELGGDALPSTLATIKAGLKRAGATDATFEALTLTGAGNHPEVIRVLHALTVQLKEGAPTQGSVAVPNLTAAQKLYPNLK